LQVSNVCCTFVTTRREKILLNHKKLHIMTNQFKKLTLTQLEFLTATKKLKNSFFASTRFCADVLEGMKLKKCCFEDTTFDDCNFQGTTFKSCTFDRATFYDFDLTNCNFQNCYFYDCVFEGIDFGNAIFESCIFNHAIVNDCAAVPAGM